MLSKTLDFKFAKENADFFNTLVYIDILISTTESRPTSTKKELLTVNKICSQAK